MENERHFFLRVSSYIEVFGEAGNAVPVRKRIYKDQVGCPISRQEDSPRIHVFYSLLVNEVIGLRAFRSLRRQPVRPT